MINFKQYLEAQLDATTSQHTSSPSTHSTIDGMSSDHTIIQSLQTMNQAQKQQYLKSLPLDRLINIMWQAGKNNIRI
jgi:hypothetical protein